MAQQHLMIDLETWGLYPGSAIRSIGAVAFYMQDYTIDLFTPSFYCNVDLDSCRALDMFVDPATEKWWSEQSPEARTAFDTPSPISIWSAFEQFNEWLPKIFPDGTEEVWSHGASFDIPLLRDVERRIGKGKLHWNYRRERDTRTMLMLASVINMEETMKIFEQQYGTSHNALHDAIKQAQQMQQCWDIIVTKTVHI